MEPNPNYKHITHAFFIASRIQGPSSLNGRNYLNCLAIRCSDNVSGSHSCSTDHILTSCDYEMHLEVQTLPSQDDYKSLSQTHVYSYSSNIEHKSRHKSRKRQFKSQKLHSKIRHKCLQKIPQTNLYSRL